MSPPEWGVRTSAAIIMPLSRLLTRRVWEGRQHLPRRGGVIIAANHLSWADPLTFAHYVYASGRLPRFMAKESLFRVPVTGAILRGARQIPVHRGSRDGADALSDGVQALRDGEAVIIYPEGTITADPDHWPMQAKTGVARLALMSGAPIVPVAQWGAQDLLGSRARGSARRRWPLLPRRTIRIRALEPVHVRALPPGEQPTLDELREVTADVMSRIRAEVAVLRGVPAPATVWAVPPRTPKQAA